MKTKRKGFTLIEVMLFLAITGVLFVGIIVGTSNSLAQQRFVDSVQNYAEFLRSIYSKVSNPQSIGDGRSQYAIYGKLISFGQEKGLDGEKFTDSEQRIFVYDVVGEVNAESGKIKDVLRQLNINVVIPTEWNDGKVTKIEPAGEAEAYMPRWGASVETTNKNNEKNVFNGSILIVRHPKSGTINTLVASATTIDVNEIIYDFNYGEDMNYDNVVKELLTSKLDDFQPLEVDFCINPEGIGKKYDNRWDVRLTKNARNASGVELIDLDLDEKDSNGKQIGNRCRF